MGLSLAFHISFTAIGIGLPLFLLITEGLYLRTRDETYRDMAKRWGRVAGVLFAIGAVSGTILSFEFGLLWPTFMDFSGGIIGFAFALEGFAFFTEAIFLALYLYGWDKLSARAHWLCTIPITISSAASAFFVISANSWMNQPQGYTLGSDGRVVDVNPFKVMFNPAFPYEFFHGTMASYVAVAFGLAGFYAIAMLRGDRSALARRALIIAMVVGVIAIPLQIVSGDLSARFVAHNQPEKFAAMESVFKTEEGAPLLIGGIPDRGSSEVHLGIKIPKMLSFLAHEDFDARIQGLNDFPEGETPNVNLVHYPFQAMVAMGFFMLFVALAFWGIAALRRRIDPGRWLLYAVAATTPLGFLAIEAGWFVTEFGRQPWAIYKVMLTEDAATTQQSVFWVLLAFGIVYMALTAALIILVVNQWRRPIDVSGGGKRVMPDVA